MSYTDKTNGIAIFECSVIESLIAFANPKGGKVLIGLNDKGQPIKGFTISTETLQKWANEIKTTS